MTTEERIAEIFKVGIFNDEEIEATESGFKSWEFYQIFHYSDEELYYLDEESAESLNSLADQKHETEKGVIFCFS